MENAEKALTSIKLTQEAYACGGSVRCGVSELTDWYEAYAIDGDGNEYRVIWALSDDYDADTMGEDCACNWDAPWAVLDSNGDDIAANAKIEK